MTPRAEVCYLALMHLRFVFVILMAGCFAGEADGLVVGAVPTETSPGRWETSWLFAEETGFEVLCAEGTGRLSVALQEVVAGSIGVLALAVGDGVACVSPKDGAFDEIVFMPHVHYRLVSYGEHVYEHWITLRTDI